MAKGKKTGGRQRGTPNKITAEIRAAWDEAVAHVQGIEGASLKDWAAANPDAFWPLTIKMLPKELKLDASEAVADLLAQARARAAR